MTGVLIMVGNSLSPGELSGNLAAFTMPITFAVLIMIVRKFPTVDMVPAQFVAGVSSCLIGFLLSPKIMISPNDIFLGEKTNGELASHFASSDVFVFPSKTDTFGIVVLESLNCGTPVAAYPVPGPKDILGGTNIDTLDDDLKASALKALKVSRQDCLDFAKKYSWEETAKIFFENISPNN